MAQTELHKFELIELTSKDFTAVYSSGFESQQGFVWGNSFSFEICFTTVVMLTNLAKINYLFLREILRYRSHYIVLDVSCQYLQSKKKLIEIGSALVKISHNLTNYVDCPIYISLSVYENNIKCFYCDLIKPTK